MKKITTENFLEASVARDHFLGLIYRLLCEGQIINSQFYYYPQKFDWLEYLDTCVDSDLALEMDVDFLEMGAALTSVNWIESSYSQESFSEKYVQVVKRLKLSRYGQRKEFQRFLNAVFLENNFDELESSMREIYSLHVRGWWINQTERSYSKD